MATAQNDIRLSTSPSWHADLQLRFARRDSRTVLAHQTHEGPLLVQRPFYPEGDVCHVYLVHPPGGLVGGDNLRLRAHIDNDAHAVITTPAATKFYRTLPDRRAVLRQELQVQHATLEWLPQETIIFRDAHAAMSTVVRLDRESHFIGWELCCYGRPASNEFFDAGCARQRFELWIDEQPVYLDHLLIDGSCKSMQAKWGLANHATLGTLLAYPATVEDLESARTNSSFACTMVDRVLSCRFIGHEGYAAKNAFVRLWQTLRPRILNRNAVLPRIWAT